MSETLTLLDQFKARAQSAGGDAWIDELLIRGSRTGIRGAHLIIGWETPGVDGFNVSGVSGANEVVMQTGDPLWEAVQTAIHATAVQQVLDLQDLVAVQAATISQLNALIANLNVQVGQLTEVLDANGISLEMQA